MKHLIKPRTLNPDGAPTNATYTSPAVNCELVECVRFQLEADDASTPVMAIKLQGSEDPRVIDDINNSTSTAKWTDLTLPAGCVHGTSASLVFSGPDVEADWDGTADLNALIDVADPPSYLRVVITRASGGSATRSLFVRVGARGA